MKTKLAIACIVFIILYLFVQGLDPNTDQFLGIVIGVGLIAFFFRGLLIFMSRLARR